MSIEYLGNKRRVLSFILAEVGGAAADAGQVADVFCGTGSVSAAFKRQGYSVIALDHLKMCCVLTEALLFSSGPPRFRHLKNELRIESPRAYEHVIAHLNQLRPVDGFIYRNYSPASEQHSGLARMYFTEENAGRIDAIRRQIADWSPILSRFERAVLLSDLVRAVSSVSNTAGTYGCYLKSWKPRALQRIMLKCSVAPGGRGTGHQVLHADANAKIKDIQCPVVYADPPYTKRQYAAYYHLLETIVEGDQPDVTGSTGLRPWEGKSSDFCYRTKAPKALAKLVEGCQARHFFLSYNDDGQIRHEEVLEILKSSGGRVRFVEWKLPRYKSSARPHKGSSVVERLYHLERG